MAIHWKLVRSGLLWIVFSPLALMMALISTVKSDVTYDVQVAACGTWSALGIVSGIGKMAGASWAVRLQMILCWVAFAAFAVPGVVMILFAVLGAVGYYPLKTAARFTLTDSAFLLGIGAVVFVTGVPFLIYARGRQRELVGR
jgi:hypothetical protein